MTSLNSEAGLEKVRGVLSSFRSIAIAFSGGTDSCFLLRMACDVIGENVTAVIVRSDLMSRGDYDHAVKTIPPGIDYKIIDTDPLVLPRVKSNPPDRCYFCKKEMFRAIVDFAGKSGIEAVAEGSNLDDAGEYRPGMKALKELGIISPLLEAGLSKSDIRRFSKCMGLETWNRPAGPCLATRVPFGTEITVEKLKAVELAESVIRGLGIEYCRVRHHRDTARIEVAGCDMGLIIDRKNSTAIIEQFRKLGFNYIALDIAGYRSGSMNEAIKEDSTFGQGETD